MRHILMAILFVLLSPLVFADGDPVKGKSKILLCVGCHGFDGNSTSTQYPKLASQGKPYLTKQILDFKSGARKDEHMTSMVESIIEADIPDVVAYFSSQKRNTNSITKYDNVVGERIFLMGIKDKNIDACASCHGEKGLGNVFAKYPLLAGQNGEYLISTLKAFRDGKRSNDPYNIMRDIAVKLSDKEIQLLASYLAALN